MFDVLLSDIDPENDKKSDAIYQNCCPLIIGCSPLQKNENEKRYDTKQN